METRKREYPIDTREFQYGEIYQIKDELIVFPESKIAKRNLHGKRLVCITQHCTSNSNPKEWTINVTPLSTQISFKRDNDLEVGPNEDNSLNKTSLIRLGASQPVLKKDLGNRIGILSEQQLRELSVLQIMLAGVDLNIPNEQMVM